MAEETTEAGQVATSNAERTGRAADVPTKPARPGTVAHQRRAHEAAAEESRQGKGTVERPAGPGEGGG